MALPRRGSRQGRAISLRRKTAWIVGPGGTSSTTISSSSSVFLGSAVQPTTEGLTVVRIRGELVAYLFASSAVAGGFTGAFGIGIATLAAVTAGIASVPTPITEQDAENWLYHRYFQLRSGAEIDASVTNDEDEVNSTVAALRWEIDSKAMRKLPSEMVLYAALEVVESAVCSMAVDFDSRVLVKLP